MDGHSQKNCVEYFQVGDADPNKWISSLTKRQTVVAGARNGTTTTLTLADTTRNGQSGKKAFARTIINSCNSIGLPVKAYKIKYRWFVDNLRPNRLKSRSSKKTCLIHVLNNDTTLNYSLLRAKP